MNLADIKRRKEARRKSLANRRVSFAPEATLHTWDVIEYLKDATSSTASSSEATRNTAANKNLTFKSPEPKQLSEDETPSTPPEEEEGLDKEDSPANQRDVHQKKRRRSSTGFVLNKEQDPITSSPSQHSSPMKPVTSDDSDDGMGDATMELDELTVQSLNSGNSGDSSNTRLDVALRQAAAQAGNQDYQDPNGDATMDLADDEVTHAFKPWVNKNRRDSSALNRHIASNDQENVDPFQSKSTHTIDDDATQDISMDITRAIGGIVSKNSDNTTTVTRSLKRRRSSNIVSMTESSGSPIQRPTTRRSLSRRQSTAEESVMDEMTMDFTVAVGKIHQIEIAQDLEHSMSDDAMDLTVPIGRIKEINPSFSVPQSPANTELLEDLSMELTENLGKSLLPPVPATPSPARARKSPRKSVLPPSITVERPHTPQKSPLPTKASSAQKQTLQPLLRRSPRKSLGGVIDGEVKLQTPEQPKSIQQSPVIAPPQPEITVELNFAPRTRSLADNLKLLSTPRKEILPSPALRPTVVEETKVSPKKFATPKKSTTPKRTRTPTRSNTPKKRVKIDVAESPEKQGEDESFVESVHSEGDKISLQDFLAMVNIRFMDLTTTKRRATGFPGADGMIRRLSVSADQQPSMENNVAAAAAIVPLLTMYQHVSLCF
jgi:kinetochore protein Spc7/SPC105